MHQLSDTLDEIRITLALAFSGPDPRRRA